MDEIGFTQSRPTVIFEDNQAVLNSVRKSDINNRNKAIDVKYHSTRDLVQKQIVNPCYIDTNWQLADMLTKSLPQEKFSRLKRLCGILSLSKLDAKH